MRHLGLLALLLSVCLLVSNIAQADTMWWIGAGNFTTGPWKELSWSGGAHWVYGAYTPGPNDEARFYSDEIEGGTTTINVASDVTVGSMTLSGYSAYTFTGSATINAGNFTYATRTWSRYTDIGNTTFAPKLNLTGQFIATSDQFEWWGAYPAGISAVGIFSTTTSGDTFGGGFNVNFQTVDINGNNNTINGGITVEGTKFQDFYAVQNGGYNTGAGYLSFGGTGNSFGAQAFNLNQYGTIDFTQSTNLSNISAINFNGGMLKLESTSNTFGALPGGFNVVSGALWVNTAASLGDPALNAIQLGGTYSFGMLTGGTDWGGAPLTQNITLNGQGGILRVQQLQYDPSYVGMMSLAGSIGGDGALVKTGSSQAWLRNGASSSDTYTGGTVLVDGTLGVESGRSLGTGNVRIGGGGALILSAAGNVASGSTVMIGSAPGFNGAGVMAVGGDFLPTLDPASNGVLQLYNAWTWCAPSGPIATALGTGIAGDGTNGNLWLGGQNWGGFYGGATLAPDQGNIYRFSSNAVNMEATLFIHNGSGGPGVLAGNNSVIVTCGGVINYDPSSFTGTLTVHNTIDAGQNAAMWNGTATVPCWGDRGAILGFYGYQQPAGVTNSALGAPTGNIVLENGVVGVTGNGSGSVGAVKADLSYDGQGIVVLNANGATAQLTLSTLTRQNSSSLIIEPAGYATNTLGTTELLLVNGTVPVDTIPGGGTMVKPFIVAANGPVTGAFLNYNSTTGFTMLPYVAMPAVGTGSEIAQTAGGALGGDVSVSALRADGALTGSANTITLGSGGLILTSDDTDTVNFKAGDGTAPLVIFRNYSGTQGVQLNGTITAGGLVLNGFGRVALNGNNASTLIGNIYINQGSLAASSDAALGAPGNNIILNGGDLHVNSGVSGFVMAHNVQVGPGGGWIDNDYSGGMVFTGTISDLDSKNPGLVIFSGGGSRIAEAMTNTGGTEFYWGGSWMSDWVNAWGDGLGNGGKPGPGPVIIAAQGSLNVFWAGPNRPDMSASAFTIMQGGVFQLATTGAKIGSLSGDGHVHFGDFWSGGYYHNMILSFGYDNTNADFYGDIDTNGGAMGAALEKWGAGTQTLWGNVNIDGTTTVNAGTLRINGYLGTGDLKAPAVYSGGWTTGPNGVTVNSGGTLDGHGIIDRGVTVNTGGHLNGSLHITGEVTVAGGAANVTGATLDGGLWMDTGSYGGSSTISGNAPDSFSGWGSEVLGGTISGTHTINGGLSLDSWDAPASLTGTNTINGNLEVGAYGDAASVSGVTTVNSPGGHVYLTGSMTGSNTINLGATGNMYVYPHSTFSGSGTVNGNYFVMDQPASLGDTTAAVSGTYTFNANVYMYGGTFSGNHTVHGSFTTAAGSNAVIAPHNAVTGNAGTLTVGAGLTLDHSTTLNFNLGAPGTIGGGINDLIDVTGNVSLDGTLNVNALTYFGQGTYTLLTYTGTLTNNLALGTMPTGGYTYTFTSGTLHAGSVYELNLSVVMPFSPGDTNHDGVLNSLDIDAIYHNFNAAANSQWKVTTDGLVVGQEDVTYELRKYFLTNYGDANLDNATDFPDFQTLLDHWQASGSTIGWAQGDFNGDYSVDFLDFQKLLDYWNPGGWHYAPMATPEPASLCLLVLGGLALLRRKK